MLKHSCLYAAMALFMLGAQGRVSRGRDDLQYPWYKKEALPMAE